MFGKMGIKCLKSYIDNIFREKVIPIRGSVVYSDLYVGVEHSGIYIGNNEIANIVVDSFAESHVEKSSPEEFSDKSFLHKKIYVSCDSKGPVGNREVCDGAIKHLGERGFYGLIFKNCHEFSGKCVDYSKENYNLKNLFQLNDIDETWERTIKKLKSKSKKKLGAIKWKLWDWRNQKEEEKTPDLNEIEQFWKNISLSKENIRIIKEELNSCNEYICEISDEGLPKEATDMLNSFKITMQRIEKKYEEVKEFIKLTGCEFSYSDLVNMNEDFFKLAHEMEKNLKIKEIIKKLGREYISEEKKLRPKIIKRMNNEILGVHKSNDLMRILPSELVNFESEELEYLFYSKFLENNLLTYEIISKNFEYNSNQKEEYIEKNKGPIIACLDTSGSMSGIPILKAKALVLSISRILEKEHRKLYIIIFGDTEELKELNISKKQEMKNIISFLNSGFGGGTNFESPLKRSVEIIKELTDYNKADILMITDGFCSLSDEFIKNLNKNKQSMDFSLYTIMCNESKIESSYSDEVINL